MKRVGRFRKYKIQVNEFSMKRVGRFSDRRMPRVPLESASSLTGPTHHATFIQSTSYKIISFIAKQKCLVWRCFPEFCRIWLNGWLVCKNLDNYADETWMQWLNILPWISLPRILLPSATNITSRRWCFSEMIHPSWEAHTSWQYQMMVVY